MILEKGRRTLSSFCLESVQCKLSYRPLSLWSTCFVMGWRCMSVYYLKWKLFIHIERWIMWDLALLHSAYTIMCRLSQSVSHILISPSSSASTITTIMNLLSGLPEVMSELLLLPLRAFLADVKLERVKWRRIDWRASKLEESWFHLCFDQWLKEKRDTNSQISLES